MNAKWMISTALALTVSMVALADEAAPKKRDRPWRRRRPAVQTGGLVFKEVQGPHLHVVNAQSRIAPQEFDRMAFELTTYASLPWRVVAVPASQVRCRSR